MERMFLTGKEIKEARKRLGMTQVAFANLLNVHHMTVNKWENDKAKPNEYQKDIIRACIDVTEKNSKEQSANLGELLIAALSGAGAAFALYKLFDKYFKNKESDKNSDSGKNKNKN